MARSAGKLVLSTVCGVRQAGEVSDFWNQQLSREVHGVLWVGKHFSMAKGER